MSAGDPFLATGLDVPVLDEERLGKRQAVLRALTEGFPSKERVRVRCGSADSARKLEVRELIRRWSGGRARVTVSDLHIRATRVLRYINCDSLSDFNLLAGASKEVASEEMLTVVVSSAGTFTDSHSDDPDGSNHCFLGRKLWLVWDTFLGLDQGLEDVERCETTGPRAAFSVDTFLAIPGSRWFVVEPGHTLFLPGHLTHKVITLEHYLGVGSFFVMLPSYVRTLERWTLHTALWALDLPRERRMDQVNRITRRVLRKVKSLLQATPNEQARWGLDHLEHAAKAWCAGVGESKKRTLLAHAPARNLLQTCSNIRSLP